MADRGSWLGRAGRNWGVWTGLIVLLFGAVGFALGVSGPPFGVAFGAGIAAGPTQGGSILLLAFLVAVVTGLVSLGLEASRGRVPQALGAIFLASAALLGGGMLGVSVGSSANLAGWAPGPTPSPRHFSFNLPSMTPAPPSHEAHATVTLALPGLPGFVPTQPAPMEDGSFGEWCNSDPGSFVLSKLDTWDVGQLGEYHLRVYVYFTDPSGLFAQIDRPVPWLDVWATVDNGVVLGQWRGPATVVEQTASTGRLRFEALPFDGSQVKAGLPATLSGEVTWTCGSWDGE